MKMPLTLVAAAVSLSLLAGCHARRGEGNGGVPGDANSSKAFDAITATETLHFVGTEPFWGGEARGDTLTYTTPGNPAGTRVKVRRFGGRNGLGLSGTLSGQSFDMTVTPGSCSDGMSDRRFPYTVTLKLGEETRQGCAWTDGQRFSEKPAG